MKKELTELVFILDCSGSMCGMEADSVGGFNSLIEKQKREEGEALVSAVRFNGERTVLYDRVPIAQVEPMRVRDFTVGGCTALFDAVGCSIHHISNIHKYAREEDIPEQTIFVIMTDGIENASRIYNRRSLRAMIEQKRKEQNWQFIFLGANIDAEETAAEVGIDRGMAVDYVCDAEGIQDSFDGISCLLTEFRTNAEPTSMWKQTVHGGRKK